MQAHIAQVKLKGKVYLILLKVRLHTVMGGVLIFLTEYKRRAREETADVSEEEEEEVDDKHSAAACDEEEQEVATEEEQVGKEKQETEVTVEGLYAYLLL